MKIGQRVVIKAVPFCREDPFKGKHGTVIDVEKMSRSEPPYYRVLLDEPVRVPMPNFGGTLVKDDLWRADCLRAER